MNTSHHILKLLKTDIVFKAVAASHC